MSKNWMFTAAIATGLVVSTSAFASSGDVAGSYASSGSYSTTSESAGSGCRAFRPRTTSTSMPVVGWGNGTSTTNSTYSDLLHHLASHGIIIAAATTSNAGTGDQMVSCVTNSRSRYSHNGRVGYAGHSQGGGGAIMAGWKDSRTNATAPIQPYVLGLGHDSRSQSRQAAGSRMLLMSGSRDLIAGSTLNQYPVYSNANVPVFWATLNGAGHLEPNGDGGGFRGITTTFFRYHLMGDSNARSLFYGSSCGVCSHSSWDVRRKGSW
jgi:hypothetical protein